MNFDAVTGRQLARWDVKDCEGYPVLACAPGCQAVAMAWSPDEDWPILRLCDRSGQLLRQADFDTAITALSFSPNGRWLAFALADGTLRLWDARTGRDRQAFAPLPEEAPMASQLVFSPDSRGLAVVSQASDAEHEEMHFYEVASGRCRRTWTDTHLGRITTVSFAPHGQRLATGGIDTTILIWDLADPPAPVGRSLAALWNDLADPDPVVAAEARAGLLAQPTETLALIRRELPPISRAPLDEPRLRWLLDDLQSSDFRTRRLAVRSLVQLGPAARSAIARVQATGTAEQRRRCQTVLGILDQPVPFVNQLRPLRAVEVLERLRTPDAQAWLQALAGGPAEETLTQAASDALARLRR
jgi:hypothetical protein